MPWHPYARLTAKQREQLQDFQRMLLRFNQKINLISQGTESRFEERHLLHSLALSWKNFPAGCSIVDWGTGGGLPLIPLAIAFPDVDFYGVDAVEKKLKAVHTMARRLGLDNVHTWHGRAEAWPGQADYAVSRATAPLANLWHWSDQSRAHGSRACFESDTWTSGLIALKGGDLAAEIQALKDQFPEVEVACHPLQSLLGAPYYQDKYIVHVSEPDTE